MENTKTPLRNHRTNNFLLSIVVPVFNEDVLITEALDKILSTPYQKEIIIIDDGSTDDTLDILLKTDHPDVKVVLHEKNFGKGKAIQTGLNHIRGDIILIQDADLEYDPSEYTILLQPIISGKADVVFGSRFAGHGGNYVTHFWHYVGNRFLTMLSNLFTGMNLTDMETCYKAFTKEALKGIKIKENRFGFEPEITAKIAKKKLRICEVPISYHRRSYEDGKKIGWIDGLSAIWCILKYNLFG